MNEEYPELEGTMNLCNDMINKKQAAVEFLNERFTYIKWMRDRDEISSETGLKWYNEALEKAKQMEKEQIIDAQMHMFHYLNNNDYGLDYINKRESAMDYTLQYYNENYK